MAQLMRTWLGWRPAARILRLDENRTLVAAVRARSDVRAAPGDYFARDPGDRWWLMTKPCRPSPGVAQRTGTDPTRVAARIRAVEGRPIGQTYLGERGVSTTSGMTFARHSNNSPGGLDRARDALDHGSALLKQSEEVARV